MSNFEQEVGALGRRLDPHRVLESGPVEELSESLTGREQEVLDLLVARELHISEQTAKFHVSSVYARHGVSRRTEAISRGARRGLISL